MPNSLKAGPVARPRPKAPAILFALAAFLLGGAARAAPPTGITLSDPWFRFITPAIPAAGYFTLSNSTADAQTLVGASSPDCGSLMLHRSVVKNGAEEMVMVPSVLVPAHGKLQFAPGGYHLMCMSPAAAMRPGRSAPVTLRFDGGAALDATFPVRNATGK